MPCNLTRAVRWNVSQFVRDPDTGKHKRRARPRADWIEHRDESLRIISEDMFERARARTRVVGNRDERLKTGGKAKYLLSGLLVCDVCSANYVIEDAREARSCRCTTRYELRTVSSPLYCSGGSSYTNTRPSKS